MINFVSFDNAILFFVVLFFTVVQSVFGVGLLVFGTPTMLLLGYSFLETLSYLLPASVVVSFLQVYKNWNQIDFYRINVIFYILPMVILGLLLVINYINFNLNLVIGSMLLLTFLIRYSKKLNKSLESYLSNNVKAGFLFIGLVHGLTNLGGAPLVILTNGIHKNKKEIQSNIAYAYLVMAICQILMLIIVGEFVYDYELLLLPLISGMIYLFLGSYVFEITSEKLYYKMMTFFILIYGFLLIFK